MNPPVLPPRPRNGLAITSLILGIAGIVLCLGPLTGIPAVVCGHLARSRIRRSSGALGGGGLAVAGLVTGYFAIVWIAFIGLLAAIAIPNFIKASQQFGPPTRAEKPDHQSARLACVANLKVIEAAKAVWALENRKTESAVPTEAEFIGPEKSLHAMPICPAGGVYTLNAVADSPQCTVHGGLSPPAEAAK